MSNDGGTAGAHDGNRTHDLNLTKIVRYRCATWAKCKTLRSFTLLTTTSILPAYHHDATTAVRDVQRGRGGRWGTRTLEGFPSDLQSDLIAAIGTAHEVPSRHVSALSTIAHKGKGGCLRAMTTAAVIIACRWAVCQDRFFAACSSRR